ncbi:MAG: hypothetical protein ABI700_20560, partial [Chloroflexota bacterium]
MFGFDDWDDVQVEFGLKEADPNKQRFVPAQLKEIVALLDMLPQQASELDFEDDFDAFTMPLPPNYKKAKAKDKAKRKQAEKSRKINRKKRK